MLTKNEIREAIRMAQSEDTYSYSFGMNDLVMDIIENHMDKHIYKYLRRITTSGLGEDDLRQIFLIGCTKAIMEANPDIGDPMMFIIQKGKWAVADELKKGYRRELHQYCSCCKTVTRIHAVGGQQTCPKCGAVGDEFIEVIQHTMSDDGQVMATVAMECLNLQDEVASSMVVEEFRDRLTGRKLEIFDLIMFGGFDRVACKNYIADIADHLGVSKGNINLRLKAIKQEWLEYMNETVQ